MKPTKLLLVGLVTYTSLLSAAPLIEIIETKSPPAQVVKGGSANISYLVRSRAKVSLTDVETKAAGMEITANDCPSSLAAGQTCTVATRFDAAQTGSHTVSLMVAAAKNKYRFTSPAASISVIEEIPVTPGDKEAVLYYKRPDGNYDGWGPHLWNDNPGVCNGVSGIETDWNSPLSPESITETYGALYRIPLINNEGCLNFIMHKGDEKNLSGGDMIWRFNDTDGRLAYTYSGYNVISGDPLIDPPLIVDGAKAHWVSASTLLWNEGAGSDVDSAEIVYSMDASITPGKDNLSGSLEKITLTSGGSISTSVRNKFPHLVERLPLTLTASVDTIKEALKGQLLAVAYSGDKPKYVTRIQVPGILDELYNYAGALGALVGGSEVLFKLWAPTAQNIRLRTGKTSASYQKMTFDPATGVWSYSGPVSLNKAFYRYEVTAYHPATGNIETHEVTDPYSLSLSTNSEYSQVVDLTAKDMETDMNPAGWKSHAPPANVAKPEDISIYESHVRDFSLHDSGGTPAYNGKFLAFTEPGRQSVIHLASLQDAGLTHMHLLPSFDIATVDEWVASRVDISQSMGVLCVRSEVKADTDYFNKFCKDSGGNIPTGTIKAYLATLEPAGSDAQYLYKHIRPIDSFNWGYDPYHYTVPEGSYASNPEGVYRIKEFRQMVMALHGMDLRVVMDVVYNHTHAHGVGNQSVLDRIVPWYYQRLNPDSGAVETSTCCSNTATEHDMMEKLMIDSLKVWVKEYKIDAFRFDLMGHHMKRNMEKALTAVRQINPQVYFYGEGWEFGEVANNARGVNANQINMAGTGIGTFSDRARDRIRGGSPFDEGDGILKTQGYATGLYYHPNNATGVIADFPPEEQKKTLCEHTDLIRLGMAANLANFSFIDCSGTLRRGEDFEYNGAPAGYGTDPQEIINYVSKHDNQTLWDILMYKLPTGMLQIERQQLHNLALGIAMLSQGIPFFHAASELLRSKSMERDSYDSGDWYNRVDYAMDDNNWNKGLPREDKDSANWELIKKVVADSTTRPSTDDIQAADAHFKAMLAIRYSSPLLRLGTEADIIDRVRFLNTGPDQVPGLIVMRISDEFPRENLDNSLELIFVGVNPSGESMEFNTGETGAYSLHTSLSSLVSGANMSLQGVMTIPARSIVVFTKPQ